jgi:hypothetical protein
VESVPAKNDAVSAFFERYGSVNVYFRASQGFPSRAILPRKDLQRIIAAVQAELRKHTWDTFVESRLVVARASCDPDARHVAKC